MSHYRDDTSAAPLLGRLETLTAIAVVGVLALIVGLIALTTPATKSVTRKVPVTNTGAFTYGATASEQSPYGRAGLRTGEPILTKVVGPVSMDFAYRLESSVPADVHGTAALVANVDLANGFSRDFPVATAQKFTGSQIKLKGQLPVSDIASYVSGTAAALGAGSTLSTATVTVEPRIHVSGSLGGRPVDSTFAPQLPFTYNGSSLTISRPNSAPDTSQHQLLNPTQAAGSSYRTSVARSVSFGPLHSSRTLALSIGFGLLLLCLWMGLYVARPMFRRNGADNEAIRIRALYGSQIVPVSGLSCPDGAIADVTSIAALADLAKRYESTILHHSGPGRDCYFVWDNGMLYRYAVATAESATDSDGSAVAMLRATGS